MSFDGSVRYAWSPNIAWRIINTIFGIVFLGITFGISVGITAKILLFIAGVITLCYGIAGIIRRPRLIITDTHLHVRRTFRDHIYPLYSVHGFRIDRPSGIIQHSPMLTFDIARAGDWTELRHQYEEVKSLPLPLPTMEDRQRDTLEIVTWGDIGVSPLRIASNLEEAGILNLSMQR